MNLGGVRQDPARAEYIEKLIGGTVEAIVQADATARPATLETGWATQQTPVAFNRRFVMRDGSVQTWMNYENPNVVRAAGPIDPQIGLVAIREENGEPRAIAGFELDWALTGCGTPVRCRRACPGVRIGG